jgi:hypothetical protein
MVESNAMSCAGRESGQSSLASRDTAGPRRPFPVSIACLAALCGLLMSTLVYFAWYGVAHSSVWIADADEILYMELASHAQYWHPMYLSDPTFVGGGQSIYSWLQIVPGELICRVLGLHPIRFGLVVRILGGLAIGFGWYALVWEHVRRSWIALVGAVFLLTDGGWLVMRPFVYQGAALARVVLGRSAELFAHNPSIHREWRIVSPVVALPFLFFYLWALRRSVEKFSPAGVFCSGLAFGLLFFAYFYFWTAAGLALLLGFLVDSAHWRTYFHTGWIGGLVGSPELARMLFTRHGAGSEWMQRFDEFVPIPRLSEHGNFLLSAVLVVITFVVTWRFFKTLLYLWCLCVAGFAMIHQQLFTGFQMQNYHWAYLFCPCMALLLVLLTINVIECMGLRGRVAGHAVIALVLLNAAAGVYLRGVEAVRTKDSQRYSRGYHDFERQRSVPEYRPLLAGAVTAGSEDFVQFAVIVDHLTPLAAVYPVILSPSVSDLDFDRRIALNAFLSGTSREEFESQQRWDLDHLQYGVELRDPVRRAARFASRLSFFDQIVTDPSACIERYHVRYVTVPTGTPRPVIVNSRWAVLQPGPTWEVLELNDGARRP